MRLSVILPALNEEANLPGLLQRLADVLPSLGMPCQVIVVDDGSSDRTADVVKADNSGMDLDLVSFPHNRGVGSALLAGFSKVCAEADDADMCFTMDSDNTQDPKLMNLMVPLLQEGAEIVIASRFRPGGGMRGCPAIRKLLSSGLSKLMSAISRLDGVTDYSTFYRGYRVGVIRRMLAYHGGNFLEGRGFEANTNLLLEAATFCSRIEEVPMVLEYDRKLGASKMRTLRTTLSYLSMVVHNLAGRRSSGVRRV